MKKYRGDIVLFILLIFMPLIYIIMRFNFELQFYFFSLGFSLCIIVLDIVEHGNFENTYSKIKNEKYKTRLKFIKSRKDVLEADFLKNFYISNIFLICILFIMYFFKMNFWIKGTLSFIFSFSVLWYFTDCIVFVFDWVMETPENIYFYLKGLKKNETL